MSPEKSVISLLARARATSPSILIGACHGKGAEVTRRGSTKRPSVTKRIMEVMSKTVWEELFDEISGNRYQLLKRRLDRRIDKKIALGKEIDLNVYISSEP